MVAKWLGLIAAEAATGVFERERARWQRSSIEGVDVFGNAAFVEDVRVALSELRQLYGFGYSLVRRYVRAVVESDVDPAKGASIGVVYRRTYDGGGLGTPPTWFAAALVRRAVATRKLVGFHIWRSRRSAVASLNHEIRAIDRLKCNGEYRHRQMNKLFQLERQIRERARGRV